MLRAVGVGVKERQEKAGDNEEREEASQNARKMAIFQDCLHGEKYTKPVNPAGFDAACVCEG